MSDLHINTTEPLKAVAIVAQKDGATHVRYVERDMFKVYRPSRSIVGAWGTAIVFRFGKQASFVRGSWLVDGDIIDPVKDDKATEMKRDGEQIFVIDSWVTP